MPDKIKSSSGKVNKATASKAASSKGRTAKKTTGAYSKSSYDSESNDAIILIVIAVVSVVLFLSNINLLGVFGEFISSIQFGLFGLPAYIFPFLIVGGAFLLALGNERNELSGKFIAICVLYVDFEIIFHMFVLKDQLESGLNPYIYCSANKSGGGVIGGILSALLDQGIGTVGTILLIILITLLCIVFIMGKSIKQLIIDSGNEVKKGSRNLNRRAQAAAAEKRRFREERKQRDALERLEKDKQWRENFTSDGNTNLRGTSADVNGMSEVIPEFGGYESQAEYEYMLKMGQQNERLSKEADTDYQSMQSGSMSDTNISKQAEQYEQDNYLDYDHNNEYPEASDYDTNDAASNNGYDMESGTINGYNNNEEYINTNYVQNHVVRPPEFSVSSLSTEKFDIDDYFTNDDFNAVSARNPMAGDPSLRAYDESADDFSTENVSEPFDYNEYPEFNNQASDFIDNYSNDDMTAASFADDYDNSTAFALDEFTNEYNDDDMDASDEADNYSLAKAIDSDYSAAENYEAAPVVKRNVSIFADDNADDTARGSSGAVSFLAKPKAMTEEERKAKRDEEEKRKPLKKWILPDVRKSRLLDIPTQDSSNDNDDLITTKENLRCALEDFGVKVSMGDCSRGPAVTRYEIIPERGVKVSKIVGLTDDIKLALAATDIRIEAPIPGKSAVGIEVPNRSTTLVSMFELLDSPGYRNYENKTGSIAFAVGKGLSGNIEIANIAKMPHVLVAGATGSGKSVCINTILMSILFKYTPNDVRLILIDPKVVELSVYNSIPHLLIPVVTDPKQAAAALNWGVKEMDDRYQRFAEAQVRDLKGYNAKLKKIAQETGTEYKPLPQLVIIVDELADLMMTASKDVEASICRLAQLARACGIHLVIATQRPSVDVITGLIKANMPSRIAFAVSSGTDSRTILDTVGAEKLLGKGDMLFFPQGIPKPERLQGAYVSDDEVMRVVEFWARQNDGSSQDNDLLEQMNNCQPNEQADDSVSASGNTASNDYDEYLADAARFLIQKEKASIGMLQRKYKIGFNRAARIMDTLCELGIVSEEEGTKPRRILMSMEQLENCIEEGLI